MIPVPITSLPLADDNPLTFLPCFHPSPTFTIKRPIS